MLKEAWTLEEGIRAKQIPWGPEPQEALGSLLHCLPHSPLLVGNAWAGVVTLAEMLGWGLGWDDNAGQSHVQVVVSDCVAGPHKLRVVSQH